MLCYAKLLHSCPTLCDPIDGSPPGSIVPGILQARILEWVAISFSSAWKEKSESEVAQSCPTLSNPMDCSLPGSSVHGIFQARVLEWGATAFSNNSYKKPLIWLTLFDISHSFWHSAFANIDNSLAKIQAEHSSSLKILFCYQVYLATSEDLAVHSPGRINTCLDCIQGKKKSKPSLNEELIVVCITTKAGVLVHLETTTHMLQRAEQEREIETALISWQKTFPEQGRIIPWSIWKQNSARITALVALWSVIWGQVPF